MVELICRTLRDGALEGEHAPALCIKDTAASPFGFDIFGYVLSKLSFGTLAGKSQSQGVVVVAFTRSPSFYVELLKRRGIDVASSRKWIQILDSYTDPLGWKDKLAESINATDIPYDSSFAHLCKDARDLYNLYSMILELGKGFVGRGKVRFSVAIDSVNEMLRRHQHQELQCEEFQIEQSGINFTSVSSEDGIINQVLPKMQFSLQLSEEQTERAKVVLLLSTKALLVLATGNDKPIRIYDGRRSLAENKSDVTFASTENLRGNEASGEGEIIYFRDSDDEMRSQILMRIQMMIWIYNTYEHLAIMD